MRNIKITGLFLLVLTMVSLNSCEKWIDEELNVDPNNPAEVPFDLLLAGAQAGQAFLYGGDVNRYTSIITQHQAGIARQHLTIGQYLITESDVNNAWGFNTYAGSMKDYVNMIEQSSFEPSSPHYRGIARVLLANLLGTTTDLWGDIPYSEAFQGFDDLTPGFDSQESIYAEIQNQLDLAIVDLNATESLISPGSGDDLIYGGDLDLWIKTANALKARYYNHLSERDAMGSAMDALAAIDAGGYTSSSEDCQFMFGSSVVEQNPWYQFNDQRGDVAMGEYLVSLMDSLNDPRLPFYADTVDGGIYAGSPAGSPITNPSLMGPFYGSPSSPVPFVTYTEQKFIEAEAALRASDPGRASTAFNEAVEASLDRYGITDAAYLATYANESGASISLEKIMAQKYIALYLQAEVWVDFRRTGLPGLSPAANAQTPGGEFPNRWPYPQSENLYNGANVPIVTDLRDKLWWDM